MRTPLALLFALSSLLAASCSSDSEWRRYDVEPIQSLGPLEFDYAGEISSTGLPEPAGFPRDAAVDDGKESDFLRLRARVVSLPREMSAEVLGPEFTAQQARLVGRAAGETLFERLEAIPHSSVEHAFELKVRRGTSSHASVSNQTAYVESFDLRITGGLAFADPCVRTARDGMQLTLETEDGAAGSVAGYRLELRVSQLQRPIAESKGNLPGLDTPIRVQTPLFTSQALAMRATTSEDEACLLGPIPWFDDDGVLLVLITADVLPEGEPAVRPAEDESAQ